MKELIRILLVEDDQDDIDLLHDLLVNNNLPFKMDVLTEGDSVIPWLSDAKILPHIIVMDLNLPKLHGRDVLIKIKGAKEFKGIPLLVLTTSSFSEDRDFCLSLGASEYFCKPSTLSGLSELITTIIQVSAWSAQNN